MFKKLLLITLCITILCGCNKEIALPEDQALTEGQQEVVATSAPTQNEPPSSALPSNLRTIADEEIQLDEIASIRTNYVNSWDSDSKSYFHIAGGDFLGGILVSNAYAEYAKIGDELRCIEQHISLDGEVIVEGVMLLENDQLIFFPLSDSDLPFLNPYYEMFNPDSEIVVSGNPVSVKNIRFSLYGTPPDNFPQSKEPQQTELSLTAVKLYYKNHLGEFTQAEGVLSLKNLEPFDGANEALVQANTDKEEILIAVNEISDEYKNNGKLPDGAELPVLESVDDFEVQLWSEMYPIVVSLDLENDLVMSIYFSRMNMSMTPGEDDFQWKVSHVSF